MIKLTRYALSLTCAWGMAPLLVRAQPVGQGSSSSAALAAEIAALLATKWSSSAAVEASYGYRDNLVLSASDEERSAFARGSVEFMLFRQAVDRFDFSAYLQADRTHFFKGREVDHEARAWFRTELGFRSHETLKLSLPLTANYSDRVLDVSDTDVQRLVAKVKETGAMIGPTVRWAFLPAWSIEAQARGERRYYEDRAFNSRVGEGTVSLGWTPTDRFELSLTGAERWRDFADRQQFSAAGRERPGTELKINERNGELRVHVSWGEKADWTTTTRFIVKRYDENGSDYLSYQERGVGQDFEWKGEKWSIRGGGTAYRVEYDVQTVGLGINPPGRVRDEFAADLRLERVLSRRWTAFAAYKWERWRSNDRIASYAMNEGLLGMRWSWEK